MITGEQFGVRLGERCRREAGGFEQCAQVLSCARRRASKRHLTGVWDAPEQGSAWPGQGGGLEAGSWAEPRRAVCQLPVAADREVPQGRNDIAGGGPPRALGLIPSIENRASCSAPPVELPGAMATPVPGLGFKRPGGQLVWAPARALVLEFEPMLQIGIRQGRKAPTMASRYSGTLGAGCLAASRSIARVRGRTRPNGLRDLK